jgi:AraC family transcriptional regulator, positive regulator of tynA and feaB
VTYISENRFVRSLSLHLPRQSLISHLGAEPEIGPRKRGQIRANRLFFQLVQDAVNEYGQACASETPYMQLAIYDLLGAMFAVPDLPTISSHTNKLFKRICNVITDRFADPNFGPCQLAAEVGISLRYLQKLFTVRSSSRSDRVWIRRGLHEYRALRSRDVPDRARRASPRCAGRASTPTRSSMRDRRPRTRGDPSRSYDRVPRPSR